jgi:PTH1 family peptidyl-tRNA hydrolase
MNTNKYLIVGLGNPDEKYKKNRHNIGYRIIDSISDCYTSSFKKYKDKSLLSKIIDINKNEIYLLKPLTYMNLSGLSVKEIMKDFDIPLENILIVVDDISLDFGKLRLRTKGSSGGHNGLKNIEKELSSNEYNRIKVGIGSNFEKGKLIDYVLSDFTNEEEKDLTLVIENCIILIKEFLNKN